MDKHCELSAEWLNDKTIRHLFTLSHPETGEYKPVSVDEVKTNYIQGRMSGKYFRWMIACDSEILGEVSLTLNPKHLVTNLPNTGWISIVIGKTDRHRKGFGSQALKILERNSAELGCKRIELGTFEFNTAAQNFYLKNGYTEIKRVENVTRWNNQLWCDVRMLKAL